MSLTQGHALGFDRGESDVGLADAALIDLEDLTAAWLVAGPVGVCTPGAEAQMHRRR